MLIENLDDILNICEKLGKLEKDKDFDHQKIQLLIGDMKYFVLKMAEPRFVKTESPDYTYVITVRPASDRTKLPGILITSLNNSFSYYCNLRKWRLPKIEGTPSFRRRSIYLENELMKSGQAIASLVVKDIIEFLMKITKTKRR
jgi:hypothetical protein